MTKYRFKFILVILIFCIQITQTYKIAANEDNYIKARNDAYKTLAEAYYNNDVYTKYKEEVIDTIGKLTDKSEKSYDDNDAQKAQLLNKLKSIFSIINQSKGKVTVSKLKAANKKYNTEAKLKQINASGDAALAYILRDALLSDDPNINIIASEYIGFIDEKKSMPLFLDLLKSEDENNIIIALNILGNLKNSDSVSEIISIQNKTKDNTVKKAAIRALSKIRTEEALNTIEKYVSDKDDSLKSLALSALISEKNNKYKQLFISLLKDPDKEEKIAPFLVDLVDRLQNQALDLVAITLKSKKKTVKIIGLASLEKLYDIDGTEAILKNLTQDDDDDVKNMLVKLISKNKSPNIIHLLNNIQFKTDEYSQKAVQIILNSENSALDPFLEDLFITSNYKIKIAIANYFIDKTYQTNKYVDYLKSLITNNTDESKYLAGSILYQHGEIELKPTIEEMYRSENPYLKLKAFILFAMKHDEIIKPELEEFAKRNKDCNTNYSVSLILYNMGNSEYLNNLIDYLSQPKLEPISKEYINKDLFDTLLTNKNDWVRLNAAQNLYKAIDKSYLNNIRNLINSKEHKVKVQVVKLLGQYGDKSDIDLLHKMVNDDNVRIRVSASEAILRILNREEKLSRS